MKVAAILLIALVGFAAATDSSAELLNEINSHPVGKAMLLSIKTSTEGGVSVQELSDTLHMLTAKEEAHNKELREDKARDLGALDETIKSLASMIKTTESNIKQTEGEIASKEAAVKTATENLAAARVELNATRDQLDEHNKICAETIANLKADIAASEKAHIAVRDAISEVQKYQAAIATSLVQLQSEASTGIQAFAKLLTEMKEVIIKKSPESSAMVHELIVLCEAPANAGSKADRILKLLQELEARVAGNLATERNNLKDTETNCDETRIRLENRILTLERKIDDLVERIKGLNEQLTVLRAELVNLKDNLKNFQGLHKAAVTKRAKVAAYYAAAIKNSDGIVAVMKKIVQAYDSNVLSNTSYVHGAATSGKGF